MAMVKKAHFVPKAYLKGFSYDKERKMVYAYNKKAGIFNTSIRDICTKKYIYRLEVAEDGNLDFIENTLAGEIEPKYSGWVSTIQDRKYLEKSAIADLSTFIALQHLRVPGSIEFIRNQQIKDLKDFAKDELKDLLDKSERDKLWADFKKERPEYYRKAIKQHPDWQDTLPEEIVQKMIEEDGMELQIDPGKNNTLIAMMDSILPVADLFMRRKWNFLFAPKGSQFITSDMPAFVAIPMPQGVVHFEYGGFGRGDASIFFPISKKVCAIIDGDVYEQNFYKTTKKKVNEINRIIASRPSLDYVISSSEKLVVKYSKFQKRPNVVPI